MFQGSLLRALLLFAGAVRVLAIPIPGGFRHAAVTAQQIIDRFINRDVSLWYFCSGLNQDFDDLGVKLRVSAVSRRPESLAQNCSTIHILYFKRCVVFQQELDCLELATNRGTMQRSLTVALIHTQIHIFVQQKLDDVEPSPRARKLKSRLQLSSIRLPFQPSIRIEASLDDIETAHPGCTFEI